VIAALWFALLVLGEFATLALVHAGPSIRYQHLTYLRDLPSAPPWALAALLLQVVLVAAGALAARRDLARLAAGLGAGPRTLAALALWGVSAATLSRSVTDFGGELALAVLLQALHLLTLVLCARALPELRLSRLRAGFDRVLGDDAPDAPAVDRFVIGCAIWATAVTALLTIFAYERHPHVPDELVYLIHGRYLARGMLAMPLPPVPAGFAVDLMMSDATRWYCPVPIGWPLAIAVGAFLGAPWAVNPVLTGVTVLLAAAFLRELYPRRTVRLTLLLLGTSPWALFLGMSLMGHTFTLACALLAAWAVARLRRDPRWHWAALGGVGIGLVALIRPLEGLAVALLLGVWSLAARGARFRFAPSTVLTLATIATGATTQPYNRYFTGKASYFPIMLYTDTFYGKGTNALGFGPNRGLGWPGMDPFPGHGLRDVLVNADLNAFQINTELLGWATGSFLALALLLALGRLRRADGVLAAVIAMIVGIHSFYWFAGGPDFGARYWYLVILPCLALSARGVEEAVRAAQEARGVSAGTRVLAAALALMLLTAGVFVPWRAADKYHDYRGMRPDVRRLAAERDFGRSLVLVRGRRFPDYASAAAYNPIDLHADVPVYAWDRDSTVHAQLLAAYPDRPVWVLDGPSRTGDGFRVVAGPLAADAARALRVPGR
jgi:hypothetical protein